MRAGGRPVTCALVPVSALVSVLVLVAGCGGSRAVAAGRVQLVPTQVEQAIVAAQKARTPELAVGAAACPAKLPKTVGSSFACTVAVEDAQVAYTVKVATAGQLVTSPAKPVLLDLKEAVQQITEQDPAIVVTCDPPRMRQLDVKATVTCPTMEGSTAGAAVFTARADGTVSTAFTSTDPTQATASIPTPTTAAGTGGLGGGDQTNP